MTEQDGARPGGDGDEDEDEVLDRIGQERQRALRLAASLARQWDDLVASSAGSNADDEHDPEGATIAFERARLGDSLDRARADLEALDQAAERLREGRYRVCERCGGPIPAARLRARPMARTCVACAA